MTNPDPTVVAQEAARAALFTRRAGHVLIGKAALGHYVRLYAVTEAEVDAFAEAIRAEERERMANPSYVCETMCDRSYLGGACRCSELSEATQREAEVAALVEAAEVFVTRNPIIYSTHAEREALRAALAPFLTKEAHGV